MTTKINMKIDALDDSIAQVEGIESLRIKLERLLVAIFPCEDVEELENATNHAMTFYYFGIEDHLGDALYEYVHLYDWKQRDIGEFFKENCPYDIGSAKHKEEEARQGKKLTLDELIAQAPDA